MLGNFPYFSGDDFGSTRNDIDSQIDWFMENVIQSQELDELYWELDRLEDRLSCLTMREADLHSVRPADENSSLYEYWDDIMDQLIAAMSDLEDDIDAVEQEIAKIKFGLCA